MEKLDVHDLIRHVVTVCGEDVQSKKIALRLRLDAAHFEVKADSARLQQVLWNILRNAVKFSPRQSEVEIVTVNGPNDTLQITIKDQGIGMSQHTIDKLFKPFEQGSDEITRRFGGLGLGLAISKALLDVQGGTIEAYSDGLGKGSVFTIILPTLSATEVAKLTPPKPMTNDEDAKRLRILLAEDHVDTARILKLVMTNWGHSVETAGTVAMAVQLAKQQPFDLVISDIGLPDGTGLDLMRQVRKFSQVPSIALTGYGMDEDITASREAGFNAHLTKPTDLQQLQSSITQLATAEA
jgi:CheY-like chemotaxis protein/anti-sigma regulatory factor (Ser/Thr protein kinase)